MAENYPIASTELEAGDVVSLASNGTGSGAWLEKADRNANPAIAGVISTAPGVTLGSNLKPSLKAAQRPLALAGRVPVKVNLEGGVITPGDLLALSDEPGIARRAQPSDAQTLGIALSAFDGTHGDTEGVVTVLVQNRGRFSTDHSEQRQTLEALTGRLDNLESENRRLWRRVEYLEKRLKFRKRTYAPRRGR